jgi:diguanylate cyclase
MYKEIFILISVLVTTLFIFYQFYFSIYTKISSIQRKLIIGLGTGIIGRILFWFPIEFGDFELVLVTYALIVAAQFGGLIPSIVASFVIYLFNVSSHDQIWLFATLVGGIGFGILVTLVRHRLLAYVIMYSITSLVTVYAQLTFSASSIAECIGTVVFIVIGGVFVHFFVSYLYDSHEAKNQLEQLATKDALTGLNNLRSYQVKLKELLQERSPIKNISLLIIDIDHFKKINDSYGHPTGDRVLQEFAGQLRLFFEMKGFPARIGGEEFAVILPATSSIDAFHLSDEFRVKVSSYFAGQPLEPRIVSASIGVASVHTDRMTAEELYAMADKALYKAKLDGRNRVCILN